MRLLLAAVLLPFAAAPAFAQTPAPPTRAQYLLETMKGLYSTQMSYIGAENKDGGQLLGLAVDEAEAQITKDEAAPAPPPATDDALEADATKTLRQLATAYTLKQRSRFMRFVSEDYRGSSSVLEDALVSDFRAYNSIVCDLRPDRVNVNGRDAAIDLRYDIALVDNQGQVRKYGGSGSFLFRRDKDGVVRVVMMAPILFGNTLPPAENPVAVRQGATVSGASTVPGFGGSLLSGSVTLTGSSPSFRLDPPGITGRSSADIVKLAADINGPHGIASIGSCSLDSVTAVPAGFSGNFAPANAGECYAVRTGTGKYAVLKVTSLSGGGSGLGPTGITISFLVQTNGTNSFR